MTVLDTLVSGHGGTITDFDVGTSFPQQELVETSQAETSTLLAQLTEQKNKLTSLTNQLQVK